MKNYFLLMTLIFYIPELFCQDTLFEKNVSLKYVFKDERESLPIINKDKNEVALFLLDKKLIKCFLLNNKYEQIDSISTDLPEKKFGTLLGYSIDSSSYRLFFTNDSKEILYVKTFDTYSHEITGLVRFIKPADEKFLESISYNNKFYLLTVQKKSSLLKIYVFEGEQNPNTEQIDFADYKFSNSDYTTLYNALYPANSSQPQKIDLRNRNPLDLTSQENKICYYNDKIYITLDNDVDNTRLITIDLNDFKYDVKLYPQGIIQCHDSYGIKSNSYIFQNILYQIKGCKDELYISVYDLSASSLIKEFRVKQDEEITFRNGPLIQEGGTTIFTQGWDRELDKTKQALRKISAGNIGISVYPSDKNLEVTIGGYKEVQRSSGGGSMMTVPGKTISTPYGPINTPPTYHYNPTMYGFGTYVNSRSVYFRTLLDKVNFNPVQDNIPKNAFDKIRDYKYINDYDISIETVFKTDNYYVLGYYNHWIGKYYLLKFTD